MPFLCPFPWPGVWSYFFLTRDVGFCFRGLCALIILSSYGCCCGFLSFAPGLWVFAFPGCGISVILKACHFRLGSSYLYYLWILQSFAYLEKKKKKEEFNNKRKPIANTHKRREKPRSASPKTLVNNARLYGDCFCSDHVKHGNTLPGDCIIIFLDEHTECRVLKVIPAANQSLKWLEMF